LVFGFEDSGIALVGDVPRGLVAPVIPDLGFVIDNMATIGAASVGLLLIGFSQTAGDARAFASKHRYRIDIDQESVAQGMSNLGSGLFQGIPVSTSLSASSLNDESGAKTPVASLFTGVLIVATLLILAPLFSELPKAVLAALIIDAVVFGMMDVAEMKRLRRVARADFWIAMAAILGVLTSGVLAGVIIGVALSLGWLVYIVVTPRMPVLGRRPGTQVFRSVSDYPDGESYPGLLVLRFDAGLFFATSDALEDRLRELAQGADPRLHTVVISFEGVDFIDSQGADKLVELLELADAYGAELRLARVKPAVLELLDRAGAIDKLGEDKIFGNVYNAVDDVLPAEARLDSNPTTD
ncbi:MAG: SulP family inorganic anion transporter, partial [Acidimicrobiales bacterium]